MRILYGRVICYTFEASGHCSFLEQLRKIIQDLWINLFIQRFMLGMSLKKIQTNFVIKFIRSNAIW